MLGGPLAGALPPAAAAAIATRAASTNGTRGTAYDGRAGQLTVRVPRIDASPVVDGSLDAPPWQQAAVLTGFSEFLPVDGVPAGDSTDVLVWYSPTAIFWCPRV